MFIAYSFVIKPKVDENGKVIEQGKTEKTEETQQRKMMTSGTIGDKKVFFDTFLRWCRRQVRQSSGLLKESKEFLRIAVVDWQFSFASQIATNLVNCAGVVQRTMNIGILYHSLKTYGWLVLLMLQSLSPRR